MSRLRLTLHHKCEAMLRHAFDQGKEIPLDTVQRLAVFALLVTCVLSTLDSVDIPNVAKGWFALNGDNVYCVLGFLLAVAGLGAAFSNLSTINRYIEHANYDPTFEGSYWVRVVLGLISGIVLGEILFGLIMKANVANASERIVLAFLGGFATGPVQHLLTNLSDAIATLLQGRHPPPPKCNEVRRRPLAANPATSKDRRGREAESIGATKKFQAAASMAIDTRSEQQTALDRFRALVMADEALADSLCQTIDAEHFFDLVMRSASARGLPLAAETIRAHLGPDPLGLARWTATPVIGPVWPPRHWLPIQVSCLADQRYVDWAHFGGTPLMAPFFEDSIRRTLSRPFNRIFLYRMTIGDFVHHAADAQSPAPSGFIFHMSRCGSTLVSQMLAAMPHTTAISEAAPIDAVVQLSHAWPGLPAERHVEYLIAMMAAFGRRRNGEERHCFVKLDSWHTLALPLFRRAFPSVPWVFLYREPVEVLVSQMRQRGTQMVAEFVSPSLYGIDDAGGMRAEDYCARVLNRICTSVVDNHGEGGGLLVNYRELPGAIWTRILPHFGVACSDEVREAMNRVARYDAKTPSFEFSDDTAAKQRDATDLVRAAADQQLGDVYRRLEVLRAGA